jgi:hypothetical protein
VVSRLGSGRALSGNPLGSVLPARQWRGVLWGFRAINGCEWHEGKGQADKSGMEGSGARISCTCTGSSSSVMFVFSVKAAVVRAAAA